MTRDKSKFALYQQNKDVLLPIVKDRGSNMKT